MKMFRMFFAASIAGLLVAAPIPPAHAVDAHNHGAATKKAPPAKKIALKKQAKSKHAGHMSMMQSCPMMQGGHGGKMSAGGMSMSPMTQWHHSMMMWHHQMMHGQSPMHRGG